MNTRAATGGLMFLALSALLAITAGAIGAGKADKPGIGRPGASLVFPLLVYSRVFARDLTGVAIARRTGAVAALTKDKLYFFKGNSAAPSWTAGSGRGWKHSQDLGISWDGRRVLFQTEVKKKKTTESMDLTLHLFDGEGRELWSKPNPYRYENAALSPSGKYILIGEVMHHGVKLYDDNLNLLWNKDIQMWYVAFDPLEHYLFDGEGGHLFTVGGDQVWNFGPYTRILSVSDNAEFVMTQYFRTVRSSQRMFLMGRLALKKIELAGRGGCVSPDGLFTAYVNEGNKLVVFRTRELLDSGAQDLPPLFKARLHKSWSMNISRDNHTLFVMGEVNQLKSVMMLIDLEKMKKVWEKPVDQGLRVALPAEDNRWVLIKPSDKMIMKFRCY